MLEKEDIIEFLNLVYAIWCLVTIAFIVAIVPFNLITQITSISHYIISPYHLMILIMVGLIIPKGKRLGFLPIIFVIVQGVITSTTGIIIIGRDDIIGILTIISGVLGVSGGVLLFYMRLKELG